MTAPLREVLVRAPDEAFGRAFDEPAHGFRHAVDLAEARRQHDAFCSLLAALGVELDFLEGENLGPDSLYTYDSLIVNERGAVPLRSGKPSRLGEEKAAEAWTQVRGIPTLGHITAPGSVDGGDTFWLRPASGPALFIQLVGNCYPTMPIDVAWR